MAGGCALIFGGWDNGGDYWGCQEDDEVYDWGDPSQRRVHYAPIMDEV